jgi:hypothetical protein
VQDCQNYDNLRLSEKIDPVREVAKEGTPHFAFYHRKLLRVVFNPPEYLIELAKKACAEAGLLVLIPNGCGLNVEV